MGDIANDVIDGFLCQLCLSIMSDHKSPGYPRTCRECKKEATNMHAHHHTSKVKCPVCHKQVKEMGLAQHQRDAHGDKK